MKRWFWMLPAAIALAATGVVLIAKSQTETPFVEPGYRLTHVLPRPSPAELDELVDQHGRRFGMDSLYRHWSFVYRLPVKCGARCRRQLKILSVTLDHWVEDEGFTNTQLILLPDRSEGKERLRRLALDTDSRFLGIFGTRAQLASWRARLFGAEWSRSRLALIDPLGRLLAYVQPPFELGALAGDYRRIRERYGAECCISGAQPLEVIRIQGREAGPGQPPDVVKVK